MSEIRQFGELDGLTKLLEKLGVEEESPGATASALKGLHLSKRLNKDLAGQSGTYRA